MPAPYKPYDHVGGVTNVSGSGISWAVTGPLANHRPWTMVLDGDVVPYDRFEGSGVDLIYEQGLATVTQAGGIATLTRSIFTGSSTGSPITWLPGAQQNLICCHHSGVALLAQNNFSDVPDPAVARDNLGAAATAVSGLSGGSNGTICRRSGSGTVVSASNTDSPALLWPLWYRDPSGILLEAFGSVPGTFTTNADYWLGTGGALVSTPPTISTTVALVYIGWASSATVLRCRPQPPVRAV